MARPVELPRVRRRSGSRKLVTSDALRADLSHCRTRPLPIPAHTPFLAMLPPLRTTKPAVEAHLASEHGQTPGRCHPRRAVRNQQRKPDHRPVREEARLRRSSSLGDRIGDRHPAVIPELRKQGHRLSSRLGATRHAGPICNLRDIDPSVKHRFPAEQPVTEHGLIAQPPPVWAPRRQPATSSQVAGFLLARRRQAFRAPWRRSLRGHDRCSHDNLLIAGPGKDPRRSAKGSQLIDVGLSVHRPLTTMPTDSRVVSRFRQY